VFRDKNKFSVRCSRFEVGSPFDFGSNHQEFEAGFRVGSEFGESVRGMPS